MKTRWWLAVLTMANLAVLICSLATMRPAVAEGPPAVLRGRGLEIVDDQGRVRASIMVIPAGTPPNAIVFGSGYVKLPTMIKTGFVLDLAAACIITVYAVVYFPWVFG